MSKTFSMMQDAVHSTEAHAGDVVYLESGAVWLTIGTEDIVLGRGQRHTVRERGTLVIQALVQARLHFRSSLSDSGWAHRWLSAAKALTSIA